MKARLHRLKQEMEIIRVARRFPDYPLFIGSSRSELSKSINSLNRNERSR